MRTTINLILGLLLTANIGVGQKLVTQNFDVKNYDKLHTSNSINVRIIADNKEGVSVRCDNRLIPYLQVETDRETLHIGLDWKKLKKKYSGLFSTSYTMSKNKITINNTTFHGGIKVTVHVKNIAEISARSAGDISWVGNLPSKNLTLRTSSSGDISWQGTLNVDNLSVIGSSSGDIVGNCKSKTTSLKLSSSSDFKGNITTSQLYVKLSSSADIKSEVRATNAEFYLSSSADAKVSGEIEKLKVTASSSADFSGKNIVYKHAEVKTSSSANIYLSKSGKVIDNTPKRTGVFVE